MRKLAALRVRFPQHFQVQVNKNTASLINYTARDCIQSLAIYLLSRLGFLRFQLLTILRELLKLSRNDPLLELFEVVIHSEFESVSTHSQLKFSFVFPPSETPAARSPARKSA